MSDAVRDALNEQARERNQSLQAYLHDLLTEQARRSVNADILRDAADRVANSTETTFDSVELIRRIRDEREAELVARVAR